MNWFKQILSDTNDSPSSKRLTGFIMIVAAIVLIACNVQSEHINTLILTGAALIGLGVADNFINKIR